MKKFAIFTEPSLADPAWLCPVQEISTLGTTSYTDNKAVLDVIWKQQYDIGHEAGRHSGVRQEWKRIRQYFEYLGWSEGEIEKAIRFQPTK